MSTKEEWCDTIYSRYEKVKVHLSDDDLNSHSSKKERDDVLHEKMLHNIYKDDFENVKTKDIKILDSIIYPSPGGGMNYIFYYKVKGRTYFFPKDHGREASDAAIQL